MSINKVIFTGNLTKDPELRTTANGFSVLNMSVAINDRVKDQATGEWTNRANFVDCVCFGKRAEAIAQYLAKGTKVAVEGKLRYSSWEKDGIKRNKLEVVVDEIEFSASTKKAEEPQSVQTDTGLYDSDIPF